MLSVAHGGGRSYAVNLLRQLERDDRGFHVTLLVPPGDLARLATRRVEVRSLPLPSGLRLPLRLLYEELVLPLRARRYDLLYGIADLAPLLPGVPTVVALRNLNIYDRRYYDNLRLRTLERLVRAGLRHVRKVVFATRAAADEIGRRLALEEARIAVVPYGIELGAFADAPPPASEAPYLFLPAALERHKNLEVLLESLLHVAEPRLELWIAGTDFTDPPYSREIRARIRRLGLEKRVRLLGLVPYQEILSYYRGAWALAFPSLLETFGHPVLEAMFAGTPLVVSDIPAFRELAGDAARYFPPRDPLALARAIDAVRAEPTATRERVERGRQRVGRFTWERSVDELCRVFESVLRQG